MTQSMTAFASASGTALGFSWTWEIRCVNGKGLDLRLRVPEWVPALEQALRARLSQVVTRGNLSLSLRLSRSETEAPLGVNEAALAAVLAALAKVEARANAQGLPLAATRASDILALRGVLEQKSPDPDPAPLQAHLLETFEPVLGAFLQARASEGAALAQVLQGQLAQIEALLAQIAAVLPLRNAEAADALAAALARVAANSDGHDPQRVAQELALLAVKSDVTEELDRLHAHVGAARELLVSEAPIGRRFDFLMQEFNREANTLCSKSQNKDLTRLGLDLKTVIDQMREQVQNVE
jgi:uncharacterized protein (TIGR00255 family)